MASHGSLPVVRACMFPTPPCPSGGTLLLLGPSGRGKSTWLALVAGPGVPLAQGLTALLGWWWMADSGWAACAGACCAGLERQPVGRHVHTSIIVIKVNRMKHTLFAFALSLLAASALAQHSNQEIQEDIARHRAMAAAHEGAAKCLASGKKEAVCMAELQAACKGLAIGKSCGMRHAH